MAEALGYLPQNGQGDAWSWAFFGAGVLAPMLTLVRAALTGNGHVTAFHVIFTGILLIIGISGFFSIHIVFPLILVLVGAAIAFGCYCLVCQPPGANSSYAVLKA